MTNLSNSKPDTPEWRALKHFLNLQILSETTPTLTAHDIPIHMAMRTAQYILWLLEDAYAEQRDEFEMARNALLPIPDVKRRWLTMPHVWNKKGLPEIGEEEARGFAVEGVRELRECRRDTEVVVMRTEEWKRR